jgi:hypothetical protein
VKFACPATDDFFRSRIDHMIDLRHPLAVLASRMPWQEIEARVAQVFSRKGRAGAALPDLDLFGEQVQRVAVASNAGRPRVPLRIMISLLYCSERLTGALLDRLTHHVHILEMNGDSYRLSASKKRARKAADPFCI